MNLEKLESFTVQTAADNDGLTAALPRRVLFCEIPGRIFGFTERFFALCVGQKRNVFS